MSNGQTRRFSGSWLELSEFWTCDLCGTDGYSNHWACLLLKLEYCLFHMLSFPFVQRSEALVGFHKTCTKKWMVFMRPHMHCIAHACLHTLEQHVREYSAVGGAPCSVLLTLWWFLVPVNLSCGAHGPAVVGWLRGHWQGYWGNPGACRARKWNWADSTIISSIQRWLLL